MGVTRVASAVGGGKGRKGANRRRRTNDPIDAVGGGSRGDVKGRGERGKGEELRKRGRREMRI